MLFSRRNFLLVSTLLLHERGAYTQQTAQPPQFRLTVWTMRPLAIPLPTAQELETNSSRWTFLHGFDKPEIGMATDAKLLEAVRKANPLFSIYRFEQKSVTLVPPDTMTGAALTGGITFKIVVKLQGREAALAEIGHTSGKAIADEVRRLSTQETLLNVDIRIPHLDASLHPTSRMTATKGYRSVKPGFLYAENAALSYSTTLAHAGQNGMPDEYTVRQEPQDVVLFCLEHVTPKGENK
jgi:hypothetical protein